MKISKEQQMGQEMKDSHDKISNFTDITIRDRMNTHRRKMDYTHRLSGFKLFQEYSLTHHCFHTGLLFMEIADIEGIFLERKDIDFVFKHDILETVIGDVLYPAKHYSHHTETAIKVLESELTKEGAEFNHLRHYTDDYAESFMDRKALQLFKACDLLELWEFCWSEYKLGNKSVLQIINNCKSILSHCGIESIENRVDNQWI